MNGQPPETPNAFKVFDRERDHHPWQEAFQEMRRLDVDRRWAVAANWRMDHRVSEDREWGDLEASGHFGSVTDASSWWGAQSLYFQTEICRSDNPPPGEKSSACYRETNRDNRISVRIPGFDELVHVGSLDGMVRRILTTAEGYADVDSGLRKILGRGLPPKPLGTSGVEYFDQQTTALAESLVLLGPDAVRQVAGLLVDGLGDRQPPWWAAFTEEARHAVQSSNATELCAALGLGHYALGQWLLVWRYPISTASPLYRPTVLEANASPWHFPSPPGYPWGITMPLSSEHPACREVLHSPLRGADAVAHCTGEILRLESLPAMAHNQDGLKALRARHRDRLRRELSMADLNAWIDRHPEPHP